ncbi:unnamed protein product [Clonostachys rosea]|uniref:RING-type domain-containing protein n=1 Tax=Bionectria ochroleuca TaxID=29856 RepID=A0ABY6U2W9_BIOOC|nr:unnamed protein product [Clonostachys rosea]
MSARADDADGQQRQTQDIVTIKNKPTTDDDTATCVICCEPISDPSETQPCKHRHFDYLCIATWLFKDPRCPVCRAPVSSLLRDSTQEVLSNFSDAKLAPDVSPPATQPISTIRRGRRRFRFNTVHRPSPLRLAPFARDHAAARARDDFNRALSRRRAVYAHGRFAMHVGSNRLSRYRELTPRLFHEDEELVSRARMWIRRELQVFPFLSTQSTASTQGLDGGDRPASTPFAGQNGPSDHQDGEAARRRRGQNAEFLLEYIIAILKSVDLMGSAGEAENMISDFIGRENTQLFLHELRAWLRSPYTKLEDWDRAVQYHEEYERAPARPESSAARREHPREEADIDLNTTNKITNMAKINVKVISDSVCPFCYLGKTRLDRAIAQHQAASPADTVSVSWQAFYLNPNAPTKSLPLNEYLASRFGPDRIGPMHSHMKALGAQEGIDFTFKSRTGNTRDSHRLVQFGKTKDAEHKVVGEIMKMYFEQGGDITSHTDLVAAVERAGLDGAEAKAWLDEGKGGKEVDEEVSRAYDMGIHGVPKFIVNGKYQIDGAQDFSVFVDTLRKAAAQ